MARAFKSREEILRDAVDATDDLKRRLEECINAERADVLMRAIDRYVRATIHAEIGARY